MPGSLKSYRVFIASPGGLKRERQAFREVIENFNQSLAIPEGFHFQAVGWEETLGGMGRPQALINDDLRTCDFFVLMLCDRWGMAPGGAGSTYTSGTEEEYHVAMECQVAGTMRQLLILFKSVSLKQLSDPGKELSKVLDFKKTLEQERRHLYKQFDSVNRFKELLRDHLTEWLRRERNAAAGTPAPVASEATASTPTPAPAEEPVTPAPATDATATLTAEAWQLADEGKLTEAETTFARAIVGSQAPAPLIEYGRFLVRLGLLDRAKAMFEDAQARAEQQQDKVALADSYKNIGNILQARGDLDGAEAMQRQSLAINEQLDRREGMANAYGNLGNILGIRGDLDGAEAMHRQSLAIEEQLGRREGMASDYGNLGLILQTRGDLDGAEAMHRQSLTLNEQLGQREGIANAYGNLGIVLKIRGDLDGAEAMQRQSLTLNEQLGRREGMALAYGNLSNILQTRGDLDGAEAMLRKGLEEAKKVGASPLIIWLEGLLDNLRPSKL